jgi:hypothetical protein
MQLNTQDKKTFNKAKELEYNRSGFSLIHIFCKIRHKLGWQEIREVLPKRMEF